MTRVVFAGGGTGGHLYPGIAVARELIARRPDARVVFAGTAAGLESKVVPREGFPLELIRSAGLKGKSPVARLRGAALIPVSALDAWRVLSTWKPDVAVGVGWQLGRVATTACDAGGRAVAGHPQQPPPPVVAVGGLHKVATPAAAEHRHVRA